MNILAQVMAYYCLTYPHPQELSDARLTKMVYLSDWFSALSLGDQITDISWYFNHYGPYVEDVLTTAQRYPDLFKVSLEQNYYGNTKKIIQYVGSSSLITLNEQTKTAVDSLIELTEIAKVRLNSDYNFTDTATKRYRYQAVYDLNHY